MACGREASRAGRLDALGIAWCHEEDCGVTRRIEIVHVNINNHVFSTFRRRSFPCWPLTTDAQSDVLVEAGTVNGQPAAGVVDDLRRFPFAGRGMQPVGAPAALGQIQQHLRSAVPSGGN